jgi:protein-S-isoprenylcysteine O-methyltransferase Ste14
MQLLTGVYKPAIILCTGVVYYAADVWFLRRYGRQRRDGGSGRSRGYTVLMTVVVLLLVAQPLVLPGLGLSLAGGWGLAALATGLLLIVAALGLHWWARQHLAQFYVEDVRLLKGHVLVDTGPYRWVRHPVFLSFLAIAVGLLLVNPAVTTLLLVVYVVADFWRAARREEALLAAKLPGYEGYMERTGRFWPKWR